jgi:hypothetical protein
VSRIVVAGYMIRHPVAGMIFNYLQHLLGLRLLGHDVVYLEESGWPCACYDPQTGGYGDDPSAGIRIVESLLREQGARIPLLFVDREDWRVWGGDREDVRGLLRKADLLLNLGGVCWLPEFLDCRRRVLVDQDPFFTQVGRFGAEGLHEYHAYFSYGANFGRPGCRIPADRVEWKPTHPPVVPEIWPCACEDDPAAPFTTVAHWSAYGGAEWEGEHYGQKDEEFLRIRNLPRYTPQKLELTLSGVDARTADELRDAGWTIRTGSCVSSSVPAYRRYLAGSRGELSVAKNAYVKSRSGWFSDRSVCYLASGRPAVLQDTGFTEWLPSSSGVQPFSTMEEAVDGIARINGRYVESCRAARELAETVFSYRVVLPPLVAMAEGS